ncbi:MAG TPA: hypothetical protein PLJ60_03980 [Chryseolinea sp.]|nr:hypothetical protein [Chryseolinea sp.]HPM29475.1 hypothetical protein [Chryseolinea sp.]
MKAFIFIIVLLLPCLSSHAQVSHYNSSKLLTSKYEGVYSYEKKTEKIGGIVIIYPETDSTVLFYIDVIHGPPSYNMGALYGRLKIKNNNGIFFTKHGHSSSACKWSFEFSNHNLVVKTMDDQNECGFGNGVFADGDFNRIPDKKLDYFLNGEAKRVYFKDTKPEDYYR